MSRNTGETLEKRNITIALTDTELRVLKVIGRQPRLNFVFRVRQFPEEIERMDQADLESYLKESAPLEPAKVARMIIIRFLQDFGGIPGPKHDPFLALYIAALYRSVSDPP